LHFEKIKTAKIPDAGKTRCELYLIREKNGELEKAK
jgi:hypothetical protein